MGRGEERVLFSMRLSVSELFVGDRNPAKEWVRG